jgi:hypothetical protein
MKYFDRLRSVEDQIVRLDSVESILRVLGNAEATREDMLNIIWYLDGAVTDINKNLSDNFYELFNEIREDVYDEIDASAFTASEASARFEQILKPFIPKEQ